MKLKALKNNLDKLKTGCLFRSLQEENKEPENITIGQVSKKLRFFQRQSEYVSEIERRTIPLLLLEIKIIKNENDFRRN